MPLAVFIALFLYPLFKLVDDATKPLARESQGPEGAGKKSYDSDPYAEQ